MIRRWILALSANAIFGLTSAFAATISFAPSSTSGQVGDQIGVDVVLGSYDPLAGLGAFDFNLNYDPLLLSFDSALGGTALGALSTGLLTTPGAGSINFAEVSFELPDDLLATQSGNLRLFTVFFDLLAPGSSALTVSSPIFGDVLGLGFAIDSVLAGQVTVTTPQPPTTPIPSPPTSLLLLAGLGILAARVLNKSRAPSI